MLNTENFFPNQYFLFAPCAAQVSDQHSENLMDKAPATAGISTLWPEFPTHDLAAKGAGAQRAQQLTPPKSIPHTASISSTMHSSFLPGSSSLRLFPKSPPVPVYPDFALSLAGTKETPVCTRQNGPKPWPSVLLWATGDLSKMFPKQR